MSGTPHSPLHSTGSLGTFARAMVWVAHALSVAIILLFSTELIYRGLAEIGAVTAFQAWVEGGVFILSLAILLITLFTKQGKYLAIAALVLSQSYFGAALSDWQILQPHIALYYIPLVQLNQWLIGSSIFLLVHALFRLGILSFAYLIPLQLFLLYGSWLWLVVGWLAPNQYFLLFFQFAFPLYLLALSGSLIAREWVHNLYAPLIPYVYATPTLITTAVCGVFAYGALFMGILPALVIAFSTFIFTFLFNCSALLIVLESLLFQKHSSKLQKNELGHYKQLSPFGLVHLDEDNNILYYNDLFQQWVESYHLPTPILNWDQYFPALNRHELFANTEVNEPTKIELDNLSIELPDGVEPSFCVFGFSEKNLLVLYLVPANAHYALTIASRLNTNLAHRLYTMQGLEEIFTNINDEQSPSPNALPSFLAYLQVTTQHTGHTEQPDFGPPITEALHQHLNRHARTPFYVGKISGNEFALIITRFTAEQLNNWVRNFINYLQREVLIRLAYGPQAARCHAGLIELGSNLSFSDSLSVARSACEEATAQNQNSVLFRKDSDELEIHSAKLHFFEQLNLGNTRGLFLLMQPIISLKNPSESYHVEVLLRFRNDEDKLLPTQPLISSAEQNGTITTIDKWVFSTTLQWFSRHYQDLEHIRCINLNLSGVALNQPEFIDELIEILAKYKKILPKICIEITESIALHDLSYTRNLMFKLQAMGLQIALDDFGAGYTSFSYLRELPANALKIDGSLIKDMLQTPSNTAIVRTIVELAQNLDMVSIAEWVEDVETLIELKKIGVDYVQGFAVSRAINPAMILDNKEIFDLIHDPTTVRYLQ